MECIAEGVRDFSRAPKYGMFFGAVYAVGGWLILWVAFALGYFYLAYPFMMGFALLAPFGAAGTYEVSRRLEAGEPLSWSQCWGPSGTAPARTSAGSRSSASSPSSSGSISRSSCS